MKIAFFDFDGTITRHDTFITFARFSLGMGRFLVALLKSMPKLILWKLHLASNSDAKQTLFRNLYRGVEAKQFCRWCDSFVSYIDGDVRRDTLNEIRAHKAAGHKVVIVSASIADWIRPWAALQGVDTLLATEIEVDDAGRLTGNFSTPNCYGPEKVRRILEWRVLQSDDEVWAYGDSSGDDAMLAIADHPQNYRAKPK